MSAARQNGLAKTLRERVGVRPAEMLRPAQANARKPVPGPPRAVALQNTVELSRGRGSFASAASQGLAAKRPVEFRAFRAFHNVTNCFTQRIDLALGVELRV